MLKIGNTEIKHGVMLAPMAGFTDSAMRKICYRHGAEYSVTEMVSAKAVVYGDRKTYKLARITKEEGPCALQIFGSEPDIMAEGAARLIAPIDGGCAPIALDINMGCPVPKIFGNAEGSALMKNPELIYKIVFAVTRAINLPVTVKLRLGVDRGFINAVECALAAESGGAALVCVHGRTRSEMYGGKADYYEIGRVKEKIKIPVIANGDITDAKSALCALRETGADGIMIGRGAIGNPFIFDEIKAALEGREYKLPSIEERVEAALLQLEMAISEKGEEVAVREARKQIALYFKSFRGSAALRAEINRALSFSEVESALKKLLFENGRE